MQIKVNTYADDMILHIQEMLIKFWAYIYLVKYVTGRYQYNAWGSRSLRQIFAAPN